jgi:hypothetical protein
MLIDKLEENRDHIGLSVLSNNLSPSHGFMHLARCGRFTFVERIALASKLNEIHRASTKLSIVEAVFESKEEKESLYQRGLFENRASSNMPSKIIGNQHITEHARELLEKELSKSYNKQLNEHLAVHVDQARREGLL